MTSVLKLYIDNRLVSLVPEPRLKNGDALVPLHAFSKTVGAEVKTIDDSGGLTICKGDICIPIDVSNTNIVSINDVIYAPLATFAESLGLRWQMKDDALWVISSDVDHIGLSIGDRPPDFTLPDLYTEESVSLKDYYGKKTVFFMWASW